jgi:enoyl-CoA hydratase/carnithine racemase
MADTHTAPARPAVRSERRDGVLLITIDRPEARNAVNPDVAAGIEAALDVAEADDGVHAVVITGAGDIAFCAGADLKVVAAGQARGIMTKRGGFAGITERDLAKPVVAAINGLAFAGGCEIMLACDMVIAAEHARFAIPEVKRGLAASAGGPLRLAQRVPLAIAMELCLVGEPIDATRAHQLGLVNRVVPADRVVDEAVALCTAIAANGPLAVRGTKEILVAAARLDDAGAWEVTNRVSRAVNGSEDAIEGATAFAQKRPPVWKGR